VLRPGVSLRELSVAERRLGVQLPPSYRRFLLCSDGALAGSAGAPILLEPRGLLALTDVEWLVDGDPLSAETWSEPYVVETHAPHEHPGVRVCDERRYLDLPLGESEYKPVHVSYLLLVGTDDNGNVVALNPQVIDPAGEWEAWELGVQWPGARRHRSFAALLEDSTRRYRSWAAQRRERDAGRPALMAIAEDPSRSAAERLHACARLVGDDHRDQPVDALLELSEPDRPDNIRKEALEHLAQIESDDARLVERLKAAVAQPPRTFVTTEAGRSFERVIAAALARSEDTGAHATALELAVRNDDPQLRRAVAWRRPDLGWTLWERGRDLTVIETLVRHNDIRALELLPALLTQTEEPQQARHRLLLAVPPAKRPALAPLAVATLCDDPDDLIEAARILTLFEAYDEATALLQRVLQQGNKPPVQAASPLGRIPHPSAGRVLREALGRDPHPAIARALAAHPSRETTDALAGLLDDPDLRTAAIDALERLGSPDALDALATQSASGDFLATKALARRRDPRALPPLLQAATADDRQLVWHALDGLRDIRSPGAGDLLLDFAHSADLELAVIATHGLIAQQHSEARQAVLKLSKADDDAVRRIADSWLTAFA
jgi:hypothetical protein